MKYILFPHGGSGNHGCEAIVRTTKQMCEESSVTLFSDAVDEDIKYMGNDYVSILFPKKRISRLSCKYVGAFIDFYVKHHLDAFDKLHFEPVISKCEKASTLISIGGDNYCYGENEYIYLVNRYARKKGARTILWGCSVEPADISDKMKEDLQGYDLIVARESITYEALLNINNNTVLYPDPAFTLEKEQGEMPEGLGNKSYVGINISPMIQGKESTPGIAMANYKRLVKEILEQTDYDIALIPHVVWSHNDDRIPLKELYDTFSDTSRVFLVEDQNCMQLKDIISKCKFFVGARTHATIAAYSTQVPTLVVGYSVKAHGIAKDLFGTEEKYVIPVQELQNEDDLLNAFNWIKDNEQQIRDKLAEVMPQYIEKAFSAAKLLKYEEE